MMSSAIPSATNSCLGSALIFVNGRSGRRSVASERIERLDAEREKLSGQLNELEVAERVVKRFGGKAGTTGKRGRARPAAQTAPAEARSAREPTGANNVATRCTRGRADARACRRRQRNRPVLVDGAHCHDRLSWMASCRSRFPRPMMPMV